jgi:hypothetical protein
MQLKKYERVWDGLVQDRGKEEALMNMLINLSVPQNTGNVLLG